MDRRTSLALALCLVVFAAFTLLQSRFAPPPKPTAVRSAPDTAGVASVARGTTANDSGARVPAGTPSLSAPPFVPASPSVLAREISLETPLYHAVFSDHGARIVSMELKRYASARGASRYVDHPGRRPKRGAEVPSGDRVVLAGGPVFGVDMGSDERLRSLATAVYAVTESAAADGSVRALTFTWQDSTGFLVRQTYRPRPDSYAIDLEVEMRNVPDAFSDYSLVTRTWPLVTEATLDQDRRSLRAVSLVGTNLHRDHADGLLKKPKRFEGDAKWAGVQSHYFMALVASEGGGTRAATAGAARRTLSAEQLAAMPANTAADQPLAVGGLVVPVPGPSDPVRRFMLYLGPSDSKQLKALGHELDRGIDLGWNPIRPVSELLLWLLNSIDRLVRNYGVTILLLATLVRALLHPLNVTSMRSMKNMQKLQPEVERIRTKYKNDAQAMNAAVMALYRENKVNPAGGCLPMLLQMPMFIALYAVLFNAIDLRQAPFVGWIHDLSAPDVLFDVSGFPIRLLPLLMAATGLIQMKLTPMDPQQAPTMMLMNVVMVFFFYNLPSGLVLYWTVMNVLTALQQWLVNRTDTPVVVTQAAGASGGRPAVAGGSGRRR